ncbi:hypothetical protein TRAPUB_5533 [Trametes pubescens]|uniref:Uncharacterized protein n=1 Tax=Trametes pubescens TaxID=154538 RepID=A0A1M2V8A6_TRAPU|nr:hypothetical protein TRAPUB_5533 [Trametes pubescens]
MVFEHRGIFRSPSGPRPLRALQARRSQGGSCSPEDYSGTERGPYVCYGSEDCMTGDHGSDTDL